ncbi:hypothetical protein QL285_098625 [Trifolium repens]|nr:hypothetical protein QL285_098625 [Trifolium repens]
MTVGWNPDECSKIWDIIIQACKVHNLTKEYAFETFHEFIQRPRTHSSFEEAWKEYLEETSSEDVDAQEGESTELVTTQIELTSTSNKSEGFEADKVIEETLETLLDGFVEETPFPPLERVIANSIDDLEEEWEKEIEICLRHLESCKEETKPQVIESVLALEEKEDSKEETVETPENEEEAYHEEEDKEKVLLQRNDNSNKANSKTEIDKVIDMICALFTTIKLKRIWKQHCLFLKFMEFLPNKQKKKDDMFFLTYMPP